ncbi:MAG: hypothetical protein ACP5R5_02890 [Armatimonadota bacterium]
MRIRLVLLILLAVVLSAAQAEAAALVAQWDFEGDPGTEALQNKVPGISWDISEVPEPSYIEDGVLHCPVAYDEILGQWGTGGVQATLATDIPDFREKTTVLWLRFDKLGDADDWIYLFRLESAIYPPPNNYNPAEAISWRSGWSTFNSTLRNSEGYSVNVFPFGLNNNGPAIQPGQLVKIAEVLSNKGDGTFDVNYYWDPYDGRGLRKYGSTINIEELYCPWFGNPANGDFVGFMFGVANLTGDTAGVSFEEARIYDGVLTPCEIQGLKYNGEPTLPPAPRLIGHWTFDEYAGTHVLADKVPDVEWTQLAFIGNGASVSDGLLILPRYLDGETWKQAGATCMLRTDLRSGYCT